MGYLTGCTYWVLLTLLRAPALVHVSSIALEEFQNGEASPAYVVAGAGNSTANGIYIRSSDTSYIAASKMQLFRYKGSWYIGKSGTGPVLYRGACPTQSPPANWSLYTWKGIRSPAPLPIVTATNGAHKLDCCQAPCAGYTLSGGGEPGVDGCYAQTSMHTFKSAEFTLFRRRTGEWAVVNTSAMDSSPVYISNCQSSSLPPAGRGWHAAKGAAPSPDFSATVAFPLGYCPPVPPPAPKPHPRCRTKECDALWGPEGCPDLNGIKPDLIRPPMVSNANPAPGQRVRAVAPSFENTQAYHALYLPTEWQNASLNKYPVIVEYMGNGPFNDGYGDISTGRPEDSNLGWGMASPAGTRYIWISMPFLTANLGNYTQISTYWWGCPSTDAARPCNDMFDISPTVNYLHAALQQTFALFNGDAKRVVITGWSRGAIATGAIGLYDERTSNLFRAFVPYSHLDGDCGWVDSSQPALGQRWERLAGRPLLYLGECAVATQGGPAWLKKLGLNGTLTTRNMEFRTTGFANHNDAWVLRNSSARAYLRQWLAKVLA